MLRISLITFLLGFSIQILAISSNPTEGARDTSVAVVVYDADAKFVPDARLAVEDYSNLIDSLVRLDTVPVSLVNQLNIYRMLASESTQRLPFVIDSIFETDEVPQPVLNAVNMYMTSLGVSLRAPTGFAAYIPESNSEYPAAALYDSWNTLVPNPSRNNLSSFDSTLTLLLVDSLENCDFHTPFAGVVTSNFGWRYGRNHNGIDIDLEVWDPVKSAFPGVVRVARYYKGFGRVVVVRHYNGLETTYAHLHRFKVKPGDIVEAGDVVGLGGSSGNSTGSHLHFEIRFQGVPIKPSEIINFRTHELRSDIITLERSGSFLAIAKPATQGEKLEYLVKSGDYLYKIAREFGVSVDDICTLNGISRSKMLKAGQKLIVKT